MVRSNFDSSLCPVCGTDNLTSYNLAEEGETEDSSKWYIVCLNCRYKETVTMGESMYHPEQSGKKRINKTELDEAFASIIEAPPPFPMEDLSFLFADDDDEPTKKDDISWGVTSHYNRGGIECIDAIKAALTLEEYRGFLKGSIIKYVWRERFKGGLGDIKKTQQYINKLVELLDGNAQ